MGKESEYHHVFSSLLDNYVQSLDSASMPYVVYQEMSVV